MQPAMSNLTESQIDFINYTGVGFKDYLLRLGFQVGQELDAGCGKYNCGLDLEIRSTGQTQIKAQMAGSRSS